MRVVSILSAGTWDRAAAADHVALDHHDRRRRRIRLTGAHGLTALLDLATPRSLADGDGLQLEDGRILRIDAAPEAVLELRCATPLDLLRLAWHVGNRHAVAELRDDALIVLDDHVLKAMAEGLGATATPAHAPFNPEQGAYAGGGGHHHPDREHRHGHSHDHGDHHHS